MSGRVVTFNTQMHADKQAGWLKRRKGSFLMMLAPIHCPKSPKSSKLKVWKATKLTKTGRSKSTKAGTPRTWRTRGETTQNRVERTRVCSAEPSANATNLQQRMSDTCSSADRLCSVLETGWYIMGLQRLSKDYDIVFSSRQLMFLISESSKPDILGFVKSRLLWRSERCATSADRKKTHWWFSAGDFFILGSKGGGDVWRLGI